MGATRVGGPPARPKWFLPLLLALAALIALVFLLSRCGNDDPADSAAAPATATTPAPATTPTDVATTPSATVSAPASAGADQAAGTVIAGGVDLLGAATAAGLSPQDGQPAVGRAAKVQSVPADEGFWVGTSRDDRVWVQLTGTRGESDYRVEQGDTVDFTGTVNAAPDGFAADKGLTAAEGAAQLTDQGHYLSVPSSSVKLSR